MTETEALTVFERTEAPGQIYGVPNRDLTARDVDRLLPDLRAEVKHSPLYAAVPSEEVLDPLGELSNEAFDKLTPAEKGARTKEAKRRAEEAEAAAKAAEDAAAAQQEAGADAGEEGED